ncbi:MAG: hypothetical protein C0433_12135, partial [Cyclobacterium sp.]|nr:hypothetical protein [Cyclobacterium sp.]
MVRYRLLILFILSFFRFLVLQAQEVSLKGKIADGSNEQPLEFANIALLNPADSTLVTGGMSDLDGTFSF